MIEVQNLTKYYGDFRAVNGISFSVNEGEITGLLGPNGAGKTTTMRIITGYLAATEGSIQVAGLDIATDPVAVKKMIGYLPESAPLYLDMLVFDYLAYAASIHRVTERSRIAETARFCGLTDVMHKNIGELSKGYRQRVGLAHAMIHDPKILILDEPTTGLDPNQIIEIRNLIKEIGKKKTVILSTHILPEVEATCDRVVIINNGNIVADSRTSELRNLTGGRFRVKLSVEGASFNDLSTAVRSISGVESFEKAETDDGLTSGIAAVSRAELRGDIFKTVRDRGWTLYEMATAQDTLEKVFRDLTTGGEHGK
jgi:ABC-2 type transport system ATP-binding protein